MVIGSWGKNDQGLKALKRPRLGPSTEQDAHTHTHLTHSIHTYTRTHGFFNPHMVSFFWVVVE